jgi:PAS domain S-box-containing protein
MHNMPTPNSTGNNSQSQSKGGKKPKRIKLTIGARYRALVEQVPAVIYTDSAENIYQTLYINPQLKMVTGYEPEEWIADIDLWERMIHPEDRERVLEEYTRTYAAQEPSFSEYRIITKDGRIIWVSDETRLIRDRNGKPLFWQGVMVDITDRKRAEEEIRKAQERMEMLVSSSAVMLYTCRAFGDFDATFVSDNIQAITGYTKEDFLSKGFWADHIHPKDALKVIQDLKTIFERNYHKHEYRFLFNDGTYHWVYDELKLFKDSKGNPLEIFGTWFDITDRKEAEEMLRETRNYLEKLLQYANAPIIVWDRDLYITRFNGAFERLTGYKELDVIGQDLSILFPSGSLAEILAKLDNAVHGETWETVEIPTKCKNGEIRTVLWNSANIYAEDGVTIQATIAQGVDITDRKQAEEALRQSEDKFKYVFDYSNIGKSITSLDGEIHVNKAFCDMLSYSPEDLQGIRWQDITHPDDIEMSQREIDSILSGEKEMARFTKRYLQKNGSIVWADVSTSLRRDNQGVPLYFIAAEIDISERKRAERVREVQYTISQAAVTENLEDLYLTIHHALGNLMPVDNFYIALYDSDADLLSFPYVVDQHDEYSPPRKPGHGLTEHVLHTGRSLLVDQQAFAQLVQKGEVELVGADSVDWMGVPLKMGDKIFGVIAVQSYTEQVRFSHADMEMLEFVSAQITPVIDRKQADALLRASEAKYRALVDTSPDGITLTDQVGKLILCNQQTARLHGYDNAKDMYSMNVFDLIAPEDRESALQNAQKTLEEGQITSITYTMMRKDGSRFPAELSAALIRDKDGNPTTFIGITRDITERIQTIEAEKRLIQLKEEFIASLSHDLRTPLFSLIGYLDLLRNGKVNDSDVQNEFLTRASKDVDRLKVLVNELLDASRLESNFLVLNWEEVDLDAVIMQVLESFREQAKARRISLKTAPWDTSMIAEVDPSRMQRVLANLVENAIKFSYEGGDILVTGESRNGTITINVIDDGCGISPEDCSKIFDKFYQVSHTHKQNKYGTGLGLFISKQIIEAHGGSLLVKSQLGIGSTFTVTIPVKKSR